MNFLSELFSSIKSRKKLYLVVYIQLTITFFSTIFAASKIGYIADYKKATSFINQNWVRPGVVDPAHEQSLPSKIEQLKQWYDYTTSLSEVKVTGNISSNGIPLDVLPTDKDAIKLFTKACAIDNTFINKFSNNIQAGRMLSSEDYNTKEYIPIVISADLKSKHKVGDIIEDYAKTKYEVIGIFKPNVFVPLNNDISNFTAVNENFIVTPLHYLETKDLPKDMQSVVNYTKYYQDVYIELKDMNSYSAFKEKADKEAERLGLPFRIKLPADIIQKRIHDELEFYSSELIIAFIIIILALLGIIAVYLSLVLKRKREFGIKLAMGTSIRHLCLMLFAEVSLLVMMSLGIITSIILILRKSTENNDGNKVYLESTGSTTISIVVATALIIIAFVSLAPILRIRKFQPSELIKDV
ncbi:ABC transporter permease [Clostridium sp. YIM B02505]|uniref:ABC transporter permease n=1 Tax=Clostridium yunnanense TaxID=2800325 RepID=A0ABS1EV21_9CLOT|nr:ABC transporter permease [Clostridium yunnanense]MBK1813178.1 ABC transporter permease [Clostridium yunnanense]